MKPLRTREHAQDFFRTDLPAGVLVPAPARRPGIRAAAVLAPVRRIARAVAAEVAVMILVATALAAMHQTALAQLTPPSPPSPVCGSAILNGPSSAPGGAVTVPAGDNSAVNFAIPGATYWFAAGTHTLGSSQFAQIGPAAGSTFLGAPGAVLDGQGLNHYAFTGTAADVTIEYLTIENFTPPGNEGAVDHDGGPGWVIEYNTIADNIPGTGVYLGSNSTLDWNCITANGQQGFDAFTQHNISPLTGGASNVTIDNNEISYNNTCNWEAVPAPDFPITPPAGCAGAGQFSGCGCSGGGKFWETDTGQFEGNYVLGNYSTGAWWDTDNTGWAIQGNYFSGNWGSAIIYEISYNALISGNTFTDNAWGAGAFAGGGFPIPAVYISESGSDSRVAGPYGTGFQITGNGFYNNWGGIVAWENANRFCGNKSPTNDGVCTLVNPLWSYGNLYPCSGYARSPTGPVGAPVPPGRRTVGRRGTGMGTSVVPNVYSQPYISDCRWKAQNVQATGNLFDFSPSAIGAACTTGNLCGFNGVFSEIGIYPPYTGAFVENNITFHQGNLFSGNTYCGPWQFMPLQQGNVDSYATWTGAPYDQDPGSTMNGPACTPAAPPPPAGPPRAPVPMPVQVPGRAGRH